MRLVQPETGSATEIDGTELGDLQAQVGCTCGGRKNQSKV
jgi:hypothetical protein